MTAAAVVASEESSSVFFDASVNHLLRRKNDITGWNGRPGFWAPSELMKKPAQTTRQQVQGLIRSLTRQADAVPYLMQSAAVSTSGSDCKTVD